MDRPTCHICQETKALQGEEVYKMKAPKSHKTILDIIKHISRVLKVNFNVPAKSKVCNACYKELIRYDCYVVELLEVQKSLSTKINARINCIGKKTPPKKMENIIKLNHVPIKFEADIQEFNEFEPEDMVEEVYDDADENEIDTDHTDDELQQSEYQEEKLCVIDDDDDEEESARRGNHKCPVCHLKLTNKKDLNYHLDNEHKTRARCNICGTQVRNEDYLVLHMNVHNGKSENECSFCDRKYARRANVVRHMEAHFPNKNKHQCERCGMFFSQSTVFLNHRLQHEAEDNPLICPVCNQSFKTKRTYKRHMITHQDDRPRYSCERCGKIFVDKYTLKMHNQTHHKDEEGEHPKKKLKTTEEQGQELFTCIICHHIFLTKDLFNNHMQNVHDVVMDS